jgi:hypothetical protein
MQTFAHHPRETGATTTQGADTAQRVTKPPVAKEGEREEGTPAADAAQIADLWALFDRACCRTNGLLDDVGQTAISVQRSPAGRRFLLSRPGEPARFIAVIPLLPTAHGRVRCGAYIGTRHRCFYVEPAPAEPEGWIVTSSGAAFDADAVQELFLQVFGDLHVGAPVP